MNRFIDYYCKFLETGTVSMLDDPSQYNGLCSALPKTLKSTNAWKMIIPTAVELIELDYENYDTVYWASGMEPDSVITDVERKLTPLRETILILCAALNNEEF